MNKHMQAVVALGTMVSLLLLQQASCEVIGLGTKQEQWRGEVIRLSWSPRAFHIKGMLTEEECEHIKKLSEDKLTESNVVDTKTGKSARHESRTSTGTFFNKGFDEIITRIEDRVAMVTMLPKENQEALQILKYVDGQKYEPHYDYFVGAKAQDQEHMRAIGGQRVATLLMYLATPEEGGETVFPNVNESLKVTGPGWSECARKGLAHKPKKGDALLFWNLTPDGNEDPHSLHGSCPTTKGEKWSATKWIHVDAHGLSAEHSINKWKGCADESEHCGHWAAKGECDKNPGYMHRNCMLSCNVCDAVKAAAPAA